MLNLGKEIQLSTLVSMEEGGIVKLGKRTYKISFSPGRGYYLNGIGVSNDQMFYDLGIENKYEWCRKNKIEASSHGVFPYMDGPNLHRCINRMRAMFYRVTTEETIPF